jgi:hypothetical protein
VWLPRLFFHGQLKLFHRKIIDRNGPSRQLLLDGVRLKQQRHALLAWVPSLGLRALAHVSKSADRGSQRLIRAQREPVRTFVRRTCASAKQSAPWTNESSKCVAPLASCSLPPLINHVQLKSTLDYTSAIARTAAHLGTPASGPSLSSAAQSILASSIECTALLSSLSTLVPPLPSGLPPRVFEAELCDLVALTSRLERSAAQRAVDCDAAVLPSAPSREETKLSTLELKDILMREEEETSRAQTEFEKALATHGDRVDARLKADIEAARVEHDLAMLARARGGLTDVRRLVSLA